MDRIYTAKSDVWSFGVLMWEIVTLGCTPYSAMSPQEIPKQLISEKYRLQRPDHCQMTLYMLMVYCWEARPEDRPSFTLLKDRLEELGPASDDYIQLNRFPDRGYYNVVLPTLEERL